MRFQTGDIITVKYSTGKWIVIQRDEESAHSLLIDNPGNQNHYTKFIITTVKTKNLEYDGGLFSLIYRPTLK